MRKDTGHLKVEYDDKIGEISDNSQFDLSYHNLHESKNSNLSSTRKTRLVWSLKLHYVFVKVIQEVGIESIVLQQLISFSLFIVFL